jgi:CRP/FNR family transcriptional regulator, cyclic AMP receptor protein
MRRERNTLEKQDASFIRTCECQELIFEAGSLGREMFVVLSGEVGIYLSEGDEAPLVIFKSGEMFGEMALVTESPRSASARALAADTKLMVINQARFVYLCSQQPAFALGVMRVLAQRLTQANTNKELHDGH